MESIAWEYRSFERIRKRKRFGEAAERILIHELTPETHDLATLPAQVDEQWCRHCINTPLPTLEHPA